MIVHFAIQISCRSRYFGGINFLKGYRFPGGRHILGESYKGLEHSPNMLISCCSSQRYITRNEMKYSYIVEPLNLTLPNHPPSAFLSRDQFSWDQLPRDQLATRSTCQEINSHEINLPQDQLSWDQLVTRSTCHEIKSNFWHMHLN